uniref:SMB domain-containing protein n=1 Tax=Strongyloides stercoralis TaxID=6248 RepID=A0A0K0EDR3_STRER
MYLLILKRKFLLISVVFILFYSSFISGRGFGGIPGEYCSIRTPTCCENRNDDCTVPILGDHLCYCDMFCDRDQDGNDCCPDFKAVCRSHNNSYLSISNHGGVCIDSKGHYFSESEVLTNNCQTCTCIDGTWSCNHDNTCLIQEDLLHKVQVGRYTWQAKNYSIFWGKTLEHGIKYKLGTLFPEKSVQNMNEILIKPRELPNQFDSREKWGNMIHGINNQGECASSWAISTTGVSSDRLAIITDGRINANLSPQQLLSCNQHRQKGCEGGYLDRAWWYIRKLGVLSEECYPYRSGYTQQPETCQVSKSAFIEGRIDTCVGGGQSDDVTIYKMTPPYRVGRREEDIMTEIITNGPVQATFLVYEDFFMYSGGVYQHLDIAKEKGYQYTGSGYHSVRIIGWGEDWSTGRLIKYWLCANSWGEDWGEKGYFRILRGENHCEIESFVIGAWGKGAKRRRRFKIKKMRKRRFRHF